MKRYEREIEEILQKIVDFPSDESMRRRAKRPKTNFWSQLYRRFSTGSLSVTTGNLTVAAVVLAILGYALRDYAPGIAPFASLAAVVLFVAVIAQSFRQRRPRHEKRWRGRLIEFPRKRLDPWDELRFRLAVLWRNLRRWTGRY